MEGSEAIFPWKSHTHPPGVYLFILGNIPCQWGGILPEMYLGGLQFPVKPPLGFAKRDDVGCIYPPTPQQGFETYRPLASCHVILLFILCVCACTGVRTRRNAPPRRTSRGGPTTRTVLRSLPPTRPRFPTPPSSRLR